MKKIILSIVIYLVGIQAFSQVKSAYTIFNSEGDVVTYETMIQSVNNADIILFGELHNNPISHWLQYEVSLDLAQNNKLVFGAEMFEADNQDELDLYLKNEINQKAFDTLARLWPNYKTDYAPLVDLAKEKQLNFIATNIPRRFASMVNKKGFEALEQLTDEEKSWIAPLPIEYDPELPGYKNMLEMMGGHGGENLPKAQAIKDATMAYFIAQNIIDEYQFIHFQGTYHSDNYEGILWYLKKLNPNLKYITISSVSQSNVFQLEDENKNKADFIICVDENMTSTY
ncbi:MAG: iron-regulated protein [Bacteroidetes bacterium GWA2_31_9b]|nr:MAG: iron-regulated protein [Bacteroidetes bacterium GWA2_31_9b]